jgi:hypothetical protein
VLGDLHSEGIYCSAPRSRVIGIIIRCAASFSSRAVQEHSDYYVVEPDRYLTEIEKRLRAIEHGDAPEDLS